eukprot:3618305-Rhodomonas_salina.1
MQSTLPLFVCYAIRHARLSSTFAVPCPLQCCEAATPCALPSYTVAMPCLGSCALEVLSGTDVGRAGARCRAVACSRRDGADRTQRPHSQRTHP